MGGFSEGFHLAFAHTIGKGPGLGLSSMERADSESLPMKPVRTLSQAEHILTGHSGAVLCFAMLDDRLLFSASIDCTIKVSFMHTDCATYVQTSKKKAHT